MRVATGTINLDLSANWFAVPGSSATNRVILTIDPGEGSVFYRLIYP